MFNNQVIAGSSGQGGFDIGQSVKFNDDDSQYLSWTPTSAGNRKTWTWAGWIKLAQGNSSSQSTIFGVGGSSSGDLLQVVGGNNGQFRFFQNGGSAGYLIWNGLLRDVSAWYHIVLALDTTQATASNRLKLYLNGEQLTSFSTENYPSQNYDGGINNTVEHRIGRDPSNQYNYFDGYMSDIYFIDGQALDPTSFGETVDGYWKAKDASDLTFSTNGWHLNFKDDVVSEGFNAVTYTGTSAQQSVSGLGMAPDLVWIKDRSFAYNHQLFDSIRGSDASLLVNATNAETNFNSFASFDADGFTLKGANGTNASGNSHVAWCWDAGTTTNFVTNGNFDESVSGWTPAQGTVTWDAASQRAYLQGPAGVSLEQTITGLDTAKTYYYTATLNRTSGTANFGVEVDGNLNYVSGSSYTDYTASGFFTPSSSSIVFDVWGGSGMYLYADEIQVFEANTQGSINSAVKANPSYGFSIVSYTGNGTTGSTLGHGLNSSPNLIITKQRDGTGTWAVWSTALSGNTYSLLLNATNAEFVPTDANYTPQNNTSSVYGLGFNTNTNASGNDYIAYCWHSVSGYSSFGSFSGSGAAGNAVTCGFRPAWVMIKRTDSANSWVIIDATRDTVDIRDSILWADLSDAEASGGATTSLDFTDTGFEFNGGGGSINASGGTYIYAAFADTREYAFWKDVSGNGNHWTPNNLDYRDSLPDTPQNNFAVLSAVDRKAGGTLSEGNLGYNHNSGAYPIRATFAANSGKWYWEVRASGNGAEQGLALTAGNLSGTYATYNLARISFYNGNKRIGSGSLTSYDTGGAATAGDVYGFAADLDNGDLTVYRNGTSLGSLHTWTADETYYSPHMDYSTTSSGVDIANFGQDSTFAGLKAPGSYTDANGIGSFQHAPPSSYLALCTSNLSIPTIIDGTEHFNTVLYTGTGASTLSITGVGFQPNWVWAKKRSAADNHAVADVVRGVTKSLFPNTTGAESTDVNGLQSFDSDGFTIGSGSGSGVWGGNSGATYVAWNWKAGGTAVSNTSGSITSSVSANTDMGFSIVSYTGTGSAATVGHSLGVAPSMVIVKNRSAADGWLVWHESLSSGTSYLLLHSTNAQASNSAYFNGSPTSSVFNIGTSTNTNGSGNNLIAYCFANSDVIKVGSYTGNGSTDGPMVFTGGRVQWMMIKATSTTGNWFIIDDVRDTYNPTNSRLYPNVSNAESDTTAFDIVSNGIKIRNNWSDMNSSGVTYIYLAIMETPLKFANAR